MSLLIKNTVLNNLKRDVLVLDGKINKIEQNIDDPAEISIDATGKILIPSLKNGHSHSSMTILRGYADDMKLQPWLEEKIWPAESKLTHEAIYWGTRMASLEMIKSGTTFCNDMYFNFEVSLKAYIDSGIKSASGPALFDFFDSKKAATMKQKCSDAIENTNISFNNSLTLPAHSIYTLSKDSLKWIADFAGSKNIPVHIHLSETEREINECILKYGIRPVELLKETGLLNVDLIAAHAIWLNDNEIDLLTKNNVTLVHNPVSNMKISTGGVFPYKKFKNRNIKMMLGTDSCASNNNLDMFEDMKIAALLQKFHTNDPEVMKADEIYNIATGNLASVFPQLSSKVEVGAHADLLLLNSNNPELIPSYNLISNLVYSANGTCVDSVICNGEVLMEGRKVKDEDEILERVRSISKELYKN
jgi:5-methylthioadenosine/S-adenosylhomocysteine deaminase